MKWVSFERQKGWKEGDGNLLSLSYPNRLRQKECNYDFLVNWIFFLNAHIIHIQNETQFCAIVHILCVTLSQCCFPWYDIICLVIVMLLQSRQCSSIVIIVLASGYLFLLLYSLPQSIPIIQIHLINSSEMNVWKCSLDCNDNLTHHELIHKHVITRASRVEKNNHFDWVDIRNRN